MSPVINYAIILFLGVLALSASQTVDETLFPKTKGADVVEATVRKIQRSGIFPHDQNLLRRLAYVETRDGEDPKTYRADYYGGILQLDQELFNRTQNVASLNTIYGRINTTWNIEWNSVGWEELVTPLHSGLGARLFFHVLSLSGKPIPGTINDQANYWIVNYNRQNQSAEYFKDEVRRLESDGAVCDGLMDFCNILDGSRSIGPGPYLQAKGFVADLVQSFSLNTTRVAFVLYSTVAENIFDFSNTLNSTEMDRIIRSVHYPDQNTNTPEGLNMAVQFFREASPRPGVPKIVATFTDGNHNLGNLPNAIAAMKAANLTSFAIGIGSEVDYNELRQIALGDDSRVFTVNDYETLTEFFYQMNQVACEVPQEPEIGQHLNGTLNQNEKRYYKFQLPIEGFTLSLSTSKGEPTGWYSFTESTPNSALHDGSLSSSIYIPRGAREVEVYVAIQATADGVTDYEMITQGGNQITTTTPIPTTPTVTVPTSSETPTTETSVTTETPTTTTETPNTAFFITLNNYYFFIAILLSIVKII